MSPRASDPTERFFTDLEAREHEPLLRKASGVARIEVADGKRTRKWLVAVDDGDVSVTRGDGDATCVMRAPKPVFDRIASGRLNAVAAVLRGELAVEGDWRLLVRMQRLFPGRRRSR
jgi:putative sterol carrier protein